MDNAIRYRVWDGKKMRYPEDVKDPVKQFMVAMNGEVWVPCGVAYNLVEMQPTDAIAMLSTGMVDKTGKEIYAGDVLDYRRGTGIVRTFTVSPIDHGAFRLASGDYAEPLVADRAHRYQVIGNVHDIVQT